MGRQDRLERSPRWVAQAPPADADALLPPRLADRGGCPRAWMLEWRCTAAHPSGARGVEAGNGFGGGSMTPEERELRRALDSRSGEVTPEFRARLSSALSA